MADNIAITEGSGTTMAADDILGVKYQRVKIVTGNDGVNDGDVGASNALPVTSVVQRSATATKANVAGSTSSVELIASNTSRLGASVFNDSTAVLYVNLGSVASATGFVVKLAAASYYEIPFGYTGAVNGLWASATGAARVVEFTA